MKDTSLRVHDLFLTACDQACYTLLGRESAHANCHYSVLVY